MSYIRLAVVYAYTRALGYILAMWHRYGGTSAAISVAALGYAMSTEFSLYVRASRA